VGLAKIAHTGWCSWAERHVGATWRSVLAYTHIRTAYQLRLSPVPPLSQHNERTSRKLPASVLRWIHLKAKLHLKMETGSFRKVVLCCVVCCDNGRSSNRYRDNTHKKPLSKIYIIPTNWRLYRQLHCESTLHHSLIHPKTYTHCCIISFGWFPGVWNLYADVSEHFVPSS